MGVFQSKKSYQVEKEEKKKGVVEQRKRSSNKPDVARNTLQMREEAKQNILEAEKRFTIRSLSDIEKVQNETETNNPVQSSEDVQPQNVETEIKSVETINKSENNDVAITKVIEAKKEEKPINTETETKDTENIKRPEESPIKAKTVDINKIENNENISKSEDMIRNEDVQNLEEEIPLKETASQEDVIQTSPDQPVQQKPEDKKEDKPLESREIEEKSEETSDLKEKDKLVANDIRQETETIEVCQLKVKEENVKNAVEHEEILEEKSTPKDDLLEETKTTEIRKLEEKEENVKTAVEPEQILEEKVTPKDDLLEETKTTEVRKLEKGEENVNNALEPENILQENPTPGGDLLEEIKTENEVKQNENTKDCNEVIKLNNEIKENEAYVEQITVIDVHSPIEPKENIKDENNSIEIKIEAKKIEIKNEENVHQKTNEKQVKETADLNKIEVYKSEESLIEEIKLHENRTKTEEHHKDNIKFDVEVYTYKEDNHEKIMEIEENSVSVTNIKFEDKQSNIQKHEVEDSSLKQSEKETINTVNSDNDNNNLEEPSTISKTTKSEKELKKLLPNHVEQQKKAVEEQIDPFIIIREIEEEVKILKEQVILFSGTTKDKDYITIKETLVRCMIKLDDIAVANNDELRNERRKVIKFAQDSLDTLQRNVVQADASSGEDSDTEKIEKIEI
ncbi:hypothetical protein ILUMI_00113 [Ignelater luminosus]|uniref:BAG domain-containing protein n=1 Tax=Ignelater luminosus TaxID=2038154 RepID=A0A8K0DGV0_IGNLU|nr:hypothetical protein ILUMI_00113 [Ignelater luminosus]